MLQPGTYTGVGNRDIHFNGKAITVRGATNDPDDCIIDCQTSGGRRGFDFHWNEKSDSRLESLTITNGYGPNVLISGGTYGIGGGIYCSYSSPTIHNCIIHDNSAPHYGGGIYLNYSNPVISNCVISQNSTASGGGAIFGFHSSPTITNCVFVDNWTTYGRGAINCQAGSPTMRNCTIVNNDGHYYDCAGIYLSSVVDCSIKNCILWDNSIWDNDEAPQIYLTSGTVTVTYSDVENGYPGTGNFSMNPLFVHYDTNLHLSSESWCIDSGDPSTIIQMGESDIDGNPRILGRIDIGAYETIPQDQPVLYLPEKILDFSAGKDSPINAQAFKIVNYGTLPFDWYIENDCNWLIIDQLSGQTEAQQTTDIVLNIILAEEFLSGIVM